MKPPPKPISSRARAHTDPVPRLLSAASLGVAIAALVSRMNGTAPAAKGSTTASQQAEKNHKRRKEKRKGRKEEGTGGREAEAEGGKRKQASTLQKDQQVGSAAPFGANRLGSWCLEGAPSRSPTSEVGQNNYFYAGTEMRQGRWLAAAAAAVDRSCRRSRLKSTIIRRPRDLGCERITDAAKRHHRHEREMT